MDYRVIIREVIEEYLENANDNSIKAVLFDFDLTLVDTLPFKGIDKDYIRQSGDISQAEELIPMTKVYNGIGELLSYLRENNIKVGVVSNRHEALVNATLQHHGIHMDVVIGEKLNCPKSVRMRDALSRLGVEPTNAIYVGDSPWDNAEARKCGMEFIGATWGNRRLSMDYNSPMEVMKYIEYINS